MYREAGVSFGNGPLILLRASGDRDVVYLFIFCLQYNEIENTIFSPIILNRYRYEIFRI